MNKPEIKNADNEVQVRLIEKYRARLMPHSLDHQVNMLKKGRPTPTNLNYVDYFGIEVPETAFLPTAFPVHDYEELLDMLQKQNQFNDPNSVEATNIKDIFIATSRRGNMEKKALSKEAIPKDNSSDTMIFTVKVLENGVERTLTASEELIYIELEKNRKMVAGIHYSNEGALILTHAFLSILYKKIGATKILGYKHKLETICYKYNMHNPAECIRLEENLLRNLRAVDGLLTQMKEYLTRLKSITLVPSSSNSSTSTSPSSPTETPSPTPTPTPTPSSPIISPGSIAANLVQASDEQSPELLEHAKSRILAVENITIPFSLDINNIPGTFDLIRSFIQNNIQKGLEYIASMLDAGQKLNYNVYTNRWGSFAIPDANFSYLEAVRKIIQPLYPRDYSKEKFLTPRFFIKRYYTALTFPGESYYSPKNAYTVNLLPGEVQEFMQKTTETTRTMREKSKSVLDSNSQEVRDQIQSMVEENKNKADLVSSEHTDYIDSKIEAKAGYNTVVVSANVNGKCDWGATNALNNSSAESVNNFNSVMKDNVTTTNSKIDTTTSEMTKEEQERTEENGSRRTVKNVNSAAAVCVMFKYIDQEYNTYHILSDVRIVFSNGILQEEFAINDLKNYFDRYLRQDAAERAQILARVKEACMALDYRNRVINLLDETVMRVRRDEYWTLLANSDHTNPMDQEHRENFEQIIGVVLRHSTFTRNSAGLAAFPMISPGEALDTYKRQEFDAAAISQKSAAEKSAAEAKIVQERARMIGKIIDTDSIPNLNDRVDAIFKLAVENKRDVLDQVYLSRASTDFQGTIKGKGFSLK